MTSPAASEVALERPIGDGETVRGCGQVRDLVRRVLAEALVLGGRGASRIPAPAVHLPVVHAGGLHLRRVADGERHDVGGLRILDGAATEELARGRAIALLAVRGVLGTE